MNPTRCTGTGCTECEAAKQHYLATGCLNPQCSRNHGRKADS